MLIAGTYIDGTLILIAITAGASVSCIATAVYLSLKPKGRRPYREEPKHPYYYAGSNTDRSQFGMRGRR